MIKNINVFTFFRLIIFLYLFYFYLYLESVKSIRRGKSQKNSDNLIKKNTSGNSNNIKNNILITKDGEDDINTRAEIIIQNNIDYNPKISIILSIYNNELYLSECLETIINQTLKEIEIICIDNGSTDNSFNILKNYSHKDRRMTILKQESINIGIAYNAGLSVAKGKYLSFLESEDYFDLNMLENMYEKITAKNSDIIICQSNLIDLDIYLYEDQKFNFNLRYDLIPNIDNFSVFDIPNYIFQISQGWTWDKLFKTDFIRSNNIRFQNTSNTDKIEFTFIALCLANSITTINKIFVNKRSKVQKISLANEFQDPSSFLLLLEKIKSNLEKKNLFNLVRNSFWNWASSFCIIKLKNLNRKSKEYLYNIIHQKKNLWDYIDNSHPSSNKYRAVHYIKYQKNFPTINIAYVINHKYINLLLVSLCSLLKNSLYENINIILLYNDITESDIKKINDLLEIRFFSLQTLYIPDDYYNDFPLNYSTTKESWYLFILAYKFKFLDKILLIFIDIYQVIFNLIFS